MSEFMNNLTIQKIIDDARVFYNIPGLSVSISCPSEVAPRDFVTGTTTIDGGVEIQPNHLFQVGSIVKSFIAVILLQLDAEGVLLLDNHISQWLPQIIPEWKNITIRQLLNHTSGIYNYTDTFDEIMKIEKNLDLNKQWTADELINIAVSQPLYFTPGQGWHYSNTNYVIAGLIIEAATNESLNEVLKMRFFIPLELQHTYYLPTTLSPDILQTMARGYSKREYFPDEPKDITELNLSWANAAGGLVSTSHDITLWFRQLVNGSLLPDEQMDQLKTTTPIVGLQSFTTNGASYGLGVIHDLTTLGEESWFHTGGTLGYTSFMGWLKAKDIVITMTANHISITRDIYVIMENLARYIRQLHFDSCT